MTGDYRAACDGRSRPRKNLCNQFVAATSQLNNRANQSVAAGSQSVAAASQFVDAALQSVGAASQSVPQLRSPLAQLRSPLAQLTNPLPQLPSPLPPLTSGKIMPTCRRRRLPSPRRQLPNPLPQLSGPWRSFPVRGASFHAADRQRGASHRGAAGAVAVEDSAVDVPPPAVVRMGCDMPLPPRPADRMF